MANLSLCYGTDLPSIAQHGREVPPAACATGEEPQPERGGQPQLLGHPLKSWDPMEKRGKQEKHSSGHERAHLIFDITGVTNQNRSCCVGSFGTPAGSPDTEQSPPALSWLGRSEAKWTGEIGKEKRYTVQVSQLDTPWMVQECRNEHSLLGGWFQEVILRPARSLHAGAWSTLPAPAPRVESTAWCQQQPGQSKEVRK